MQNLAKADILLFVKINGSLENVIFFSEKVPANQARNLGTNLLKAAMK